MPQVAKWLAVCLAVSGCLQSRVQGEGEDAEETEGGRPPLPAQTLTSASGRISGPTYVLQAQLGSAVDASIASSATYTFETQEATKPGSAP